MEAKDYDWDELMKYRSAKPFRPFFFEMKSGELVEVLGPLWFGGVNNKLGVFQPRRGYKEHKVSDIVSIRLLNAEEICERIDILYQRPKRA